LALGVGGGLVCRGDDSGCCHGGSARTRWAVTGPGACPTL